MKKRKLLILLFIFAPFIMGYTIEDKDISVTVGEVEVPVYNLEVTWDTMKFTYVETVNYIWDNQNYTYELTDSTYKWDTSANNVKITNKSPNKVNIELKYLGEKKHIIGNFDITKKTLEPNETIISKLTLNGYLSSDVDEYIKIGTINLLIS